MSQAGPPRRLAAEFVGSTLLAAIVIGSGIAAQRLSPTDTGLELLENSAATAAGLFVRARGSVGLGETPGPRRRTPCRR
jgi:glycerol uptake facilitator-like aquaporin